MYMLYKHQLYESNRKLTHQDVRKSFKIHNTLLSIDHRNAKFLITPWQAVLAEQGTVARGIEKARGKAQVQAHYRSVEAEYPLLLSHFAFHRLVDDFEATRSFLHPSVDHELVLDQAGFRFCSVDFLMRC
jgi:hypothetical protein